MAYSAASDGGGGGDCPRFVAGPRVEGAEESEVDEIGQTIEGRPSSDQAVLGSQ